MGYRIILIVLVAILSACGGGDTTSDAQTSQANPTALTVSNTSTSTTSTTTTDTTTGTATATGADTAPVTTPAPVLSPTDETLYGLIDDEGLTGQPAAGRNLPDIDSPMAQLGKLLFFSKNLGGEQDAACVSCHHPALGGTDHLSLAVGVHAVDANNIVDPELLGPGRHSEVAGNFPLVGRNAPTVFNAGLQDAGMFWDSRVESQGREPLANGAASPIATPDGPAFNRPDTSIHAGTTLPAAQARFPVTVSAEMRGDFEPDADHQTLRADLAAKFNDPGGNWATLFESAFGDPAITFDRIADAIGEYERSMNFTASPWSQYVAGNTDALTEQQKQGAILFFTPVNQGGGGCSRCHSGDAFSDGRFHLVGFPQVSDDHGRENIDGNADLRYHFRTPSLLNVSETAPYGHAGSYNNLTEVVRHYVNPQREVDNLFGANQGTPFANANAPVCRLDQVSRMVDASGQSCADLLTDAYNNSQLPLTMLANDEGASPLGPRPRFNATDVAEVVSFLESLTDPCIQDRTCIDPWIVDADDIGSYPDNSALIAHDETKLDL